MKTLNLQSSRRQFIQQLGLGVAGLGLAANAPLVFANSIATLPFRQNAAPLFLHWNENSLGMSPTASLAAKTAIDNCGIRYPHAAVDEFKLILADLHPSPLHI